MNTINIDYMIQRDGVHIWTQISLGAQHYQFQ